MKLAIQVNNYVEYLAVINYYDVFEGIKLKNDIIRTEKWYDYHLPLYVCIGSNIHIKGFRKNVPQFGNDLSDEYNNFSFQRWMISEDNRLKKQTIK